MLFSRSKRCRYDKEVSSEGNENEYGKICPIRTLKL